MPVKNQKPKECATLLQQGWTCVDVRTVEEFEAGHPAGAFNVPVMTRGPAGMVPNPEFVAVVSARFPKTSKLVLNCGSGGRSMRGCEQSAARATRWAASIRAGRRPGCRPGRASRRDARTPS
jgi:rhodanese-related sulfurtransferase